MPEFGNMDIRDIYEGAIESWLFRLRQEGTGAKTLNHLITCLRLIFGYAVKHHDIEDSPMEHLELFALKSAEKGILTRAELNQLFQNDPLHVHWGSQLHFILNMTAVLTGMRLGELLALKFDMVQPSYITVAHSWNTMDKLKGTKNNKVRRIPIPDNLYQLLRSLDNGFSEFIFSWSGKPLDHKTVYKHFYRALEKIGIDQAMRRARNITFHSYRHGFNTMLIESGITPETVRLLTGHSVGMTARYSHAQLENINYPAMLEPMGCIDTSYGAIPAVMP
jgi:integrase